MARFDDGLIRIETTLNEQPGSLFLDTGASMTALFERSVKRLGIDTEAKEDATPWSAKSP